MKTSIIALALGATLLAPPAASAETQTVGTAPVARTFLIVDAQSGRTIATLVPIDADPRAFRLVGTLTAPRVRLEMPAADDAWLTPGQLEAKEKSDDRATFYAPPDAG